MKHAAEAPPADTAPLNEAPTSAGPFVPAHRQIAELSWAAVLLGCVLSAVLAAANAYLGLFAGMTVSASIPAAVLSMGLLRPLKGTILENNAVQTAASAGESVAAGAIFTLPALILLGAWERFDYTETALLTGLGGLLGVLFTVPLRRALVTSPELPFPEGVVTAEVLKLGAVRADTSSDEGQRAAQPARALEARRSLHAVVWGGALGVLFKFGEGGAHLWRATLEGARFLGGGALVYGGANLSPALMGVGYIVGLDVAALLFIGGALNWFIAVPVLAAWQGASGDALDVAWSVWSQKTRYLGVGAMIVGGLWALVDLRDKVVAGVRAGIEAYHAVRAGGVTPRTERDLPMPWMLGAAVASLAPLCWVFFRATHVLWVSALLAVVMLVAGFLFCAVAAYMAGLVGSSNNPVSGVTIATLLLTSLLLLGLLGPDSAVGPAAAILVGSVVCCAAAIGGDNVQDLKAGSLLGSTPIKQQTMQVLGVLAGALVMAPVLSLLLEAYGIGVPTEQHPKPLKAPQATLMAAVARGVFAGGLPWGLVGVGMGIAVLVIALDRVLRAWGTRFRVPVLAVAVGIYLPLELSVAILVGGVVSWLARRAWRRSGASGAAGEAGTRPGLLFSAGLITGEALAGIGLAVPIVVTGRSDVLAPWGVHEGSWPGVVLLVGVGSALWWVATRVQNSRGR